MKKIIVGLLVAMMFVFAVNANEIGSEAGSSVTTSTVYLHEPSRYIVTIPATMTAAEGDGLTYPITPTLLDLCPGDEVLVSIHGVSDGLFTMTTETGKKAGGYVGRAGDTTRLYDGDIVARFDLENPSEDYIVLQMYDNAGPGNYFGTLTFEVSLNEQVVIW